MIYINFKHPVAVRANPRKFGWIRSLIRCEPVNPGDITDAAWSMADQTGLAISRSLACEVVSPILFHMQACQVAVITAAANRGCRLDHQIISIVIDLSATVIG